jgi:hypothetical protein
MNSVQEKIQELEKELLQIDGVNAVEFDLDNYEDCHQVILLPHYDAGPLNGEYYRRRAFQLAKILTVCAAHDLHNSGDRIEDYETCWYIVRNCGKTWPRNE